MKNFADNLLLIEAEEANAPSIAQPTNTVDVTSSLKLEDNNEAALADNLTAANTFSSAADFNTNTATSFNPSTYPYMPWSDALANEPSTPSGANQTHAGPSPSARLASSLMDMNRFNMSNNRGMSSINSGYHQPTIGSNAMDDGLNNGGTFGNQESGDNVVLHPIATNAKGKNFNSAGGQGLYNNSHTDFNLGMGDHYPQALPQGLAGSGIQQRFGTSDINNWNNSFSLPGVENQSLKGSTEQAPTTGNDFLNWQPTAAEMRAFGFDIGDDDND